MKIAPVVRKWLDLMITFPTILAGVFVIAVFGSNLIVGLWVLLVLLIFTLVFNLVFRDTCRLVEFTMKEDEMVLTVEKGLIDNQNETIEIDAYSDVRVKNGFFYTKVHLDYNDRLGVPQILEINIDDHETALDLICAMRKLKQLEM